MKKFNKILIVSAFLLLTSLVLPLTKDSTSYPGGGATIQNDMPPIESVSISTGITLCNDMPPIESVSISTGITLCNDMPPIESVSIQSEGITLCNDMPPIESV